MKTIGIFLSHYAGFELKQHIKGWLETKGWGIQKTLAPIQCSSCDYGTFLLIPWHWPFLKPESVTGYCYSVEALGISMTLNKHQGIRAALCWTAEIAHLVQAAFCWKAEEILGRKGRAAARSLPENTHGLPHPAGFPFVFQCRRSSNRDSGSFSESGNETERGVSSSAGSC